MKFPQRLVLAAMLFLAVSCQPKVSQTAIQILDGEQVYTIATAERLPSKLLAEANITLSPADRLLYLGAAIPLDQPLPEAQAYTLQVRRAVTLTLVTPDGEQVIETAAFTVGQALAEAGISLYAADLLDPPAETPIIGTLTVTYTPSREITVRVDGQLLSIRSAAATVEQALAGAGIPLVGLDVSFPSEDAPLPKDGQIHILRVVETVSLSQKSIPFNSSFEASADLELDQQGIVQAGEAGLAMARVRIRYEDGQEAARQEESESIIRPARDQIAGYGTKVVIHTATVDGVTIQYWRAVRVYTTSYSPCRSAADRCYSGTASGKAVQKGVVSVVSRWYAYMAGQPIYIPGYGYATIEDIGGGFSDRYWVDLAWSDDDYQPMEGWNTVFFLVPVPANILYILPYR